MHAVTNEIKPFVPQTSLNEIKKVLLIICILIMTTCVPFQSRMAMGIET